MQPYSGYYIYPPRTTSKIPYTKNPVLDMWRKWPDAVAQLKLNGTRNLIIVQPDRSIQFWNRHKELQKYVIPAEMRSQILDMSPAGYYTVWDTELVHTKTKDVKDVLYFFDCLVWESQHLLGSTYAERFAICQRLICDYIPYDSKLIKEHIYIAQNFPVAEWDAVWQACKTCNHIEGLVLKRTGPSSRLLFGGTEKNNGSFMCRIRKYNKNLLF